MYKRQLITFGIPAVLLLFSGKKKTTILESLITFAAIACAWIGGYALMWVGKWTVATLVLHENIYLDAIQQIILRTNDEVKNLELTYSMVLEKNLELLQRLPYALLFLSLIHIFNFSLEKKIRNVSVYWQNLC